MLIHLSNSSATTVRVCALAKLQTHRISAFDAGCGLRTAGVQRVRGAGFPRDSDRGSNGKVDHGCEL
jgi:hypothetical protein